MTDLKLNTGYLPGLIGRIAELHSLYYHEHWGFGAFFEAKVASELARFIARYDANRDGLWSVTEKNRVEGSIVMDRPDESGQGAHLRRFITSPEIQGKGWGGRLIDAAMDFCRNTGYEKVYLWTFEGLYPARRLYEKAGFRLVEQHIGRQWGKEVTEQRFEALLS